MISFLFFFRHLAWKSLKFLTTLNSLDLRSSASVKSNRACSKRQQLKVLHSCIVVNSKKPLLPKRGGGGGARGERGGADTGGWQECYTTAGHTRTTTRSGSVHHRNHTWNVYSALINGRTDAINYINSWFFFSFFFFLLFFSPKSEVPKMFPLLSKSTWLEW